MSVKRKRHTASLKARVALAAIKGEKTVNELAREYELHPMLIHGWKKQLLDGAEGVFGQPPQRGADDSQSAMSALFEQIGRLKVEVEWLKKKSAALG